MFCSALALDKNSSTGKNANMKLFAVKSKYSMACVAISSTLSLCSSFLFFLCGLLVDLSAGEEGASRRLFSAWFRISRAPTLCSAVAVFKTCMIHAPCTDGSRQLCRRKVKVPSPIVTRGSCVRVRGPPPCTDQWWQISTLTLRS